MVRLEAACGTDPSTYVQNCPSSECLCAGVSDQAHSYTLRSQSLREICAEANAETCHTGVCQASFPNSVNFERCNVCCIVLDVIPQIVL